MELADVFSISILISGKMKQKQKVGIAWEVAPLSLLYKYGG